VALYPWVLWDLSPRGPGFGHSPVKLCSWELSKSLHDLNLLRSWDEFFLGMSERLPPAVHTPPIWPIPASKMHWSRTQRIILGWWIPVVTPSEQGLRAYGSRAFDQNFKGWYLLKHSPTKLLSYLFFLSSTFSFPFFPFVLLPFLNWLWNWSIFLNYLLYLLNKVFNVPVLKFRLSLPFTYLPPSFSIPKNILPSQLLF
jgi:hypothetical protein